MKGICFVLILSINCLYAQSGIGINTSNPQQALHLAGSSGTLRVESLNHTNNSFNGGDVDNDGDLTNNIFPLYVDENGDFTLELQPLSNSEDLDALNDIMLPTSTVTLVPTNSDGEQYTNIQTFSIEVSRAAILEVKYNISYNIYLDNSLTVISDNLSRRVDSYIEVDGDSRQYAVAKKGYASGSTNSVQGIFYNFGKSYITLPSSGTYTINLVGGVSSAILAASATGDPSLSTYVEFAVGHDFVFFRLH